MRLRSPFVRLIVVAGTGLSLVAFGAARAQAFTDTTQVQWDVAGLGYLAFSGVDGVSGPDTTAAVRAFQSNHSACLAVDGDAGAQTNAVLANEIRQIQKKVGATADADFGPVTESDVKKYQSAHGLTADGQAGAKTMSTMGISRGAGCAALGNPTPPPVSPTPPAGSSLRSKIVSSATSELGNSARNHEIGGYNCNYYSTQLAAGTAGACSNGWRTEEWCADFARWIYGKAGARTTDLTAGAASFWTYGKHFGTWHDGLSGVKVGDAVVFDLDKSSDYASHFGLVTSVSSGVVMISGNSGPNTNEIARSSVGSASGYAEPVS
jgi:peptidoglycan hydrolase-like protein with peptidoglycan-binding domain